MNKTATTEVKTESYESRYAAYRKSSGKSSVQKPQNTKGTVRRFFSLLKPHTFSMIIICIMSMTSTVVGVLAPEKLSGVINYLQNEITQKLTNGDPINFDGAQKILIELMFLYVGSSLATFVQQFISVGVSQKLVCRLRANLNIKMAHLPLRFFDKNTKGEIISRMMNDIENLSSNVQSSMLTVITGLIQMIGSLVMMLYKGNLIMTLLSVCLVPVSGFLSYKVSRISKKWFKRYWDTMGDLNGHIEEMYTGHSIIRIFGHEQKSIDEFNVIVKRLGKNSFAANMIAGVLNPTLTLIKNINYVSLCVAGGYFCLNATSASVFGIGDIQAFLSYSSMFSSPILNISSIINNIQSSLASAERVFNFLDEEEQMPDDTSGEPLEKTEGDIEFKDVCFSYTPDVPLISDLSFHAKSGSITAIVGPTGAGKTTIVNLLMRFYDIDSGHIYLDGKDIYTIGRETLRSNFGMVLQDTWLFKGTIRDNITYGRDNATEEMVIEAAKAANIHDYIMSLPKGYDTMLAEDGTNLSQGQRQLLTIARAILASPTVLILDEATSSVDTRTELMIQEAMSNLMQGRTSFVIAHRISTIRNADNILVMRRGSIIEQGTHDQLMEANGFYALLYNSQYTDGIPTEESFE